MAPLKVCGGIKTSLGEPPPSPILVPSGTCTSVKTLTKAGGWPESHALVQHISQGAMPRPKVRCREKCHLVS